MKLPTTYRLINLLTTATTWPEAALKEAQQSWGEGARPCEWHDHPGDRLDGLRIRLRAAILVFLGRADAVVWPEDEAAVFPADVHREPDTWSLEVTKDGESHDAVAWLYCSDRAPEQHIGESMMEAYNLARRAFEWLPHWTRVEQDVEEGPCDYTSLTVEKE